MKPYVIHRLPEGRYELTGVFDPALLPAPWNRLEDAAIAKYPWAEEGSYRPEAHARVGWNGDGLHVLMYANEPVIRKENTAFCAPACQDSCLEFFVQCAPEETDCYINLESTPYPIMYLSHGTGRHDRVEYHAEPEGMHLQASEHQGTWWAVSYTVPMAFIEKIYGRGLAAGQKLRGDFFKCGDKMAQAHYGMWHGTDTALHPRPDFHQPAMFGEMILE